MDETQLVEAVLTSKFVSERWVAEDIAACILVRCHISGHDIGQKISSGHVT